MTSPPTCSDNNNAARPYHVILCAMKDIKGLLAANAANQFLTPRGVKLTIILGQNPPKSEGAMLAAKMLGYHEYSCWFDANDGYLASLQREENHCEQRNSTTADGGNAFFTFEEMQKRGIDVIFLEKTINHPSNLEMIRRLAPDVMLSARFLQIFKAPVISIPTHGILNMHPGALPYYRGLYVDVRAMMRKLDFATTTVHEVDTGIDTGTFIDEYPFPVHLNKSLFWHRLNMDLAGLNIMFQHVMKLSGLIPDDGVARKTKDYRAHGEGEYFTYPNAEEWQQFQDMGLKLYDESDIDFVKGLFDKRLPNAVRMFTVSSKGEAATEDTTTSSSQKENIQNDQSCYQRADRLISTRS